VCVCVCVCVCVFEINQVNFGKILPSELVSTAIQTANKNDDNISMVESAPNLPQIYR
jgi:hypothetical protein